MLEARAYCEFKGAGALKHHRKIRRKLSELPQLVAEMLCGRTQLPTAASSLFQVEILSCFITFSPSLASCQCPASPEAPSEQMSSPLALRESQLTEFSLFLLVLALDG